MPSPYGHYDRLVDSMATRSENIKDRCVHHVEENYVREKLKHGIHIIDLLSDRLALAELSLLKKWRFSRYKYLANKMGLWF